MTEARNITYDEFEQKFARKVEEIMKEKYSLQVTAVPNSVLKADNSNSEKKTLTMKFDDTSVCPTIYPEKLYSDYLFGVDLPTIAGNAAKMLYASHEAGPFFPSLTPEEARKQIRLAVINTKRNTEILKEVPHFEIGDISAVPRWYLTEDASEGSVASILVKNELAARLGFIPDEVLAIAKQNTVNYPFIIQSMDEILKKTMVSGGMDPEVADTMIPEMGMPILVITTENNIDGAACLLSEPTLEAARQRLNSDEVICLPSSRQEIILISADENSDLSGLSDMVREINRSTVSPEDFLSDHPMKWDGQKLKMLIAEPAMETPIIDAQKLTMKMGGL